MGAGFIFLSVIMIFIPILIFNSRKLINISFLKWHWLLRIIGIISLIILIGFRIQSQILLEIKNLTYQTFKNNYRDTRTQLITGFIPFDLCPLLSILASLILIFPKKFNEKWFMSIGIWGMYGATLTLLTSPPKGDIVSFFATNNYTLSTHVIQYILSFVFIVQAKTHFKRDYINTKIVILSIIAWAILGVIVFDLTKSNTGVTNDSWIVGSYKEPREIFGFSKEEIFFARITFWTLSLIVVDVLLISFTFLKNYLVKKEEKYKDKKKYLITTYLELKIDLFSDKTKKIIEKINKK